MRTKFFLLNLLLVLLLMAGGSAAGKHNPESEKLISENKKILIVYFSHSGNTKEIAYLIQKLAGGDLFEIQTVMPYPKDYSATTRQAKQEQSEDFKPALKESFKNMKTYDIVLIGYPIWWGTYPMTVKAFLINNSLSGKILVPFCTHMGSGLGRSIEDLKILYPKTTILEGLAVRGNEIKSSQSKVSGWLRKNKIIR